MEITGTIEAVDGSHDRITVAAGDYEEAHTALLQQIPDGHKLIVIRTA